jgi:hypothetical protein
MYDWGMKKLAFLGLVALLAAAPAVAMAEVDASLIPDGTYIVKVEKVVDDQHVTVMMNNGIETTLPATNTVSFAKLKPNDTIKISVLKGKVPVYLVH